MSARGMVWGRLHRLCGCFVASLTSLRGKITADMMLICTLLSRQITKSRANQMVLLFQSRRGGERHAGLWCGGASIQVRVRAACLNRSLIQAAKLLLEECGM